MLASTNYLHVTRNQLKDANMSALGDLDGDRDPVDAVALAAVADTFVDLARSFSRARARLLAAAEADVEWSAHVVLKCLASDGPMRSSALADTIQADPSTVSRQVASLVKDGLLERRTDPEDGRASLLVPTTKADAVLAAHDRARVQHFGRMLAEWSNDDLRTFARMLARFTTDFESANHSWRSERSL